MDPKPSADTRRLELDRAIEVKAFQIECAEAIADNWVNASDRGWLLSLLAGTMGTALAVTRGRSARDWDARVTAMRQELIELRVERRILDQLA